MVFSNLTKVAWKAIILNKLRTFLTMLGIIIGVGSVITMLAIGEGSKQSIKSQISQMGSNMITIRAGSERIGGVRVDDGSQRSMTIKDVEAIQKNAKNIEYVSPIVQSSGQTIHESSNWPSSIYGVYPEYLSIKKMELKSGSMFTERHINQSAKVAVIGQTVVDNLFKENENPIGQTIRFKNTPFQIIGVLESKGENTFGQDQDNVILAPFSTVQKRLLSINYVNSIVASAKDESVAEQAVDEVTEILQKVHKSNGENDPFRIMSMEELLTTASSTTDILTTLLVAIAGISLLIGGIGIMNIMYVSVKERTREIGLRMAVGARSKDILLQFLTEAIFISVTGGLIGVVVGISAAKIITIFTQWPTIITVSSLIISFFVCAVTGIFFGWYPAKKAANLDPIVALRYE
ncbi:MAG: ABC transporter permease [Bacteroidales bacterium]|nr:ABC transporter permease [Bacteroidales bacterium]